MKVLVTGGAGFIGSHVVDHLVEASYEVVVVDNLTTGRREYVHPRAKFYPLDLADPKLDEVFAKERPEYVNHHAAQISVLFSVRNPLEDARHNILGSLRLLESCRQHGVKKLIYASTGGAIYGEPAYLPCDEAHPLNPLAPYGASKHAVEHYLYLYRENFGLDYTTLRYANVYGPRQDPFGEAGVVAIFTQRMLQSNEVIINGSGDQERDFVYVSDVAAANVLAMDKGSGEIYNLATGQGTSVKAIFQALKALTDYERAPVYGPAKKGEVFKIYLDARKAAHELGWVPRVSFEEGLRETVAFFRSQGTKVSPH